VLEDVDEVDFVVILLAHNAFQEVSTIANLGLKPPVQQMNFEAPWKGEVLGYLYGIFTFYISALRVLQSFGRGLLKVRKQTEIVVEVNQDVYVLIGHIQLISVMGEQVELSFEEFLHPWVL
jgi:hypothetical protein